MSEIKKGGYLYESSDPKSRSIDGLLSRIRNACNTATANPNGTVGAGSNSGNAATHSRNRRKRPNAAFESCIKNIEEVQSRYGVDDHYIFAVERGDYNAAQRMVDESANTTGYTTIGYHGSSADFTVVNGWLWTSRDRSVAQNYYGRNGKSQSNRSKVYAPNDAYKFHLSPVPLCGIL